MNDKGYTINENKSRRNDNNDNDKDNNDKENSLRIDSNRNVIAFANETIDEDNNENIHCPPKKNEIN